MLKTILAYTTRRQRFHDGPSVMDELYSVACSLDRHFADLQDQGEERQLWASPGAARVIHRENAPATLDFPFPLSDQASDFLCQLLRKTNLSCKRAEEDGGLKLTFEQKLTRPRLQHVRDILADACRAIAGETHPYIFRQHGALNLVYTPPSGTRDALRAVIPLYRTVCATDSCDAHGEWEGIRFYPAIQYPNRSFVQEMTAIMGGYPAPRPPQETEAYRQALEGRERPLPLTEAVAPTSAEELGQGFSHRQASLARDTDRSGHLL